MAKALRGYLALGTNLGRRLGNLEHGIQRLASTPELIVQRVSSIYDSAPWGYDSPNRYLNVVVEILWIGTAERLLAHCQNIEEQCGRERGKQKSAASGGARVDYEDRTLDIDVLWLEGEERNEADFVLPHALAHMRAFILEPWCELAPGTTLRGRKLEQWLDAIAPSEREKTKKLGSVELGSLKLK